MKSFTKILSVILVVAVIFGVVSVPVGAEGWSAVQQGYDDPGADFFNPYGIEWRIDKKTLVFQYLSHGSQELRDRYSPVTPDADKPDWEDWTEHPEDSYTYADFCDGITKIGAGDCMGALGLQTVEITKDMKTIRQYAFYGCTNIKTIIYHGTRAQWENVTVEENNGILGLSFEEMEAAGVTFTCSASGHSFGAWSTTKNPTCTEAGEKTRTCSTCGYEEKQSIDPLNHDWQKAWSTDGTYHWHACSRCTEVKDKAEHDLSAWEADDANHWHKCPTCEYETAKSVHSYGEWITVTPATTTTPGQKKRTCSDCLHVQYEEIPVIGYILGDVDGDGFVTEDDATALANHIAKKTVITDATRLLAADANEDGKLNVNDCITILGLIK